jgi:serine/threonine-protein kinase RsbW
MTELVIESTLEAARAAEEQVLEAVEKEGFRREDTFGIRLSLEEAITNAVKHGNKNDASRHIYIRYAVNSEALRIWVGDDGPGFDPKTVPDPTLPSRLSLPSGRGIMLMRAYMDEVTYNDAGNEVCLVKRRA